MPHPRCPRNAGLYCSLVHANCTALSQHLDGHSDPKEEESLPVRRPVCRRTPTTIGNQVRLVLGVNHDDRTGRWAAAQLPRQTSDARVSGISGLPRSGPWCRSRPPVSGDYNLQILASVGCSHILLDGLKGREGARPVLRFRRRHRRRRALSTLYAASTPIRQRRIGHPNGPRCVRRCRSSRLPGPGDPPQHPRHARRPHLKGQLASRCPRCLLVQTRVGE